MPDPTIVAGLSALKLEKAVSGPLPDLAVLRFTGDDTESFLQSQLTQDVAGLSADRAALAGYCTAKGRLLATGVLLRRAGTEPAGFDWIVRADLAAALQKRLTMFVLRSKVKISVLDTPVLGRIEPDNSPNTTLPTQTWEVASFGSGIAICAPSAAGFHRYWILAGEPETQTPDPNEVASYFDFFDCLAGLPWVQAATQDVFIPQTLNLELIGGVSFTKGCYPGQEVVARSHYRGLVKRRASLGWVAQALAEPVGQDLFLPGQSQPVSRIIHAATLNGQTWVLWEAMKDTLSEPVLQVGHPEGPTLKPLPLPYSIGLQEDKT